MVLDLETDAVDVLPGRETGQAGVLVGPALGPAVLGLVLAFPVDRKETEIGDNRPRGHERRRRPGRRRRRVGQRRRLDPGPRRRPGGVVHLRGHGPLPDQLVEAALLPAELPSDRRRRPEALAGGADGLVRLLRVLHLAPVRARGGRDGLVAVERPCLLAGGRDRGIRQRRRVGAHVGDVTALVEPSARPASPAGRRNAASGPPPAGGWR